MRRDGDTGRPCSTCLRGGGPARWRMFWTLTDGRSPRRNPLQFPHASMYPRMAWFLSRPKQNLNHSSALCVSRSLARQGTAPGAGHLVWRLELYNAQVYRSRARGERLHACSIRTHIFPVSTAARSGSMPFEPPRAPRARDGTGIISHELAQRATTA